MDRLRKRLVLGLTVIAAFAFAGVAIAAEGDDTVLNYGYDPESHFFVWNVTSLDYSPDLELLDEILDSQQEEQLAALLEACGLEGDDPDSPSAFTYTFDPATGVITVTSEEESEDGEASEEIVCGAFNGGDVTGPAGQVNHGMFMKLFNQIYEGENRGCVVSQIARSGLGKGDQQVQADPTASDDEEPIEPTADDVTVVEGSISFTTVTTDCQRGKGGEEDGNLESEDSEGNGPPQHVLDKFGGQHPGDAKGKSANNPGRP